MKSLLKIGRRSSPVLVLISIVHSLILTQLIYFPYPELFIYPYLANSGLSAYKQIFDQHFPGLMFFPINLDTLGMHTAADARLWSISIVILVHVLLFLIARSIFASDKKALFANLIYLVWQPFFEGWVLWIDSFLPLFLLPAFYFSFLASKRGRSYCFFLSGLFFGVALLFKQVVLPLVLLIFIALYWRNKSLSGLAWYFAGFVPFPIIMVAYFWIDGTFSDFWYWTVVFNLTTFAAYGRKAPFFSGIVRLVAVFGITIFSLARRRELGVWIALFLVGSLAFITARFDFIHLQPALPFVALGTILAFEWIWKNSRTRFLAMVYIAGTIYFLFVFYSGHLSNRVLFFDEETEKIAKKIRQETELGEHIFIYGAVPHLYPMSKTIPAGDVFVFQFPWFAMVAEDKIIDGLRRDQPRLVVADRGVRVAEQAIVDYMAKTNSYLLENYETVEKIGSTEFLVRKDLKSVE